MSEEKKTAADQAKKIGLKSLTEVSNITGTSLQTLINWSKNKPHLFKSVLYGCSVIKQIEREHNAIKK
jgi:hypothetical protein